MPGVPLVRDGVGHIIKNCVSANCSQNLDTLRSCTTWCVSRSQPISFWFFLGWKYTGGVGVYPQQRCLAPWWLSGGFLGHGLLETQICNIRPSGGFMRLVMVDWYYTVSVYTNMNDCMEDGHVNPCAMDSEVLQMFFPLEVFQPVRTTWEARWASGFGTTRQDPSVWFGPFWDVANYNKNPVDQLICIDLEWI